MDSKVITVLGLALCAMVNGHAISEQKVVRYYGKLEHIGEKVPEHHEEYAWAYPAYEFSYKVDDKHTHDIKGQEESRQGDEVKGEYWLIQPDGRKRTVTYQANKHDGFKAHVDYSEIHHENIKHDEHKPIVEHAIEHKEDKHVEIEPEHRPHLPHIDNKSPHELIPLIKWEPNHEHINHEEPKPHVENEVAHIHEEHKHVEFKPEYKPHLPHIDHKPPREHVPAPHIKWEPRREHHHVPHYKLHFEPHHVPEPIHEHKPMYSHKRVHEHKKDHHVPIPPLPAYTPRHHKTIEHYHDERYH